MIHRNRTAVRASVSLERIACLLGAGCLLIVGDFPAQAQFTGSYELTPPNPGQYMVPSQGPDLDFGVWKGRCGAFRLEVDTSLVPDSLILNSTLVDRVAHGEVFTYATTAGLVNFEYTIEGHGDGYFAWFIEDTTLQPTIVSNLVVDPTIASFAVETGSRFGFAVNATGRDLMFDTAQRTVRIQNFSFNPASSLTLQSAVTLVGPFDGHEEASVDRDSNTITVPRPEATRFFRLRGSQPFRITRIVLVESQIVISYE